MWTRNGESSLPQVLTRIDEAIPAENVHRKILIDDHSIDRTVEIAKDFAWETYKNPKTGVLSGANEAVRRVDCPFFVSVEQDILVAKNWWKKISKYMEDPTVAVAQGVRIATQPVMRKIDKYAIIRDDLRHTSLDNNMCRTAVVRKFACYGEALKEWLNDVGLKWVIDRTVVSDHIRDSVSQSILHDYMMTAHHSGSPRILDLARLFVSSPIRAADIARKEKCVEALVVYPADRLAMMMAWAGARVHRTNKSKRY